MKNRRKQRSQGNQDHTATHRRNHKTTQQRPHTRRSENSTRRSSAHETEWIETTKRTLQQLSEPGASSWLGDLPLKSQGFNLNLNSRILTTIQQKGSSIRLSMRQTLKRDECHGLPPIRWFYQCQFTRY